VTPDSQKQRISYVFLCASLIVVFILASLRPLRTGHIATVIGVVVFAAIAVATSFLGRRAIRSTVQDQRLLSLAGILLIVPFAIVGLLWVGIGPPWMATATENQMRYLVLSVMSIAIASGLTVLKEALKNAGESFYSTVGFAMVMLAGPLYLVFNAFGFAAATASLNGGKLPSAFHDLNEIIDMILFLAGALTYLASAAFAASLGRVELLSRGAARCFAIVSLIAFALLLIRGLHFPDPRALSTPWYANPGFAVGIPAVPFIIPFYFGVVLLRRAGDETWLE
jgi:hypothetical protein